MALVHNFDEMVDLRSMPDSKKYLQYPPDVLPMWIADSDFKSPQPVIDALVARMRQGMYGYTPISSRLHKAAAKWQKERYGWEVDPDWVEFCPTIIAGMIWATRALSRPGDNIVLQTPSYPPFKDLADNNGRHVLRNALILKDGRYEIDFEDLEKKLSDPRTKLFILCNPQNPTGRVFSREELVRMGQLCLKHHVVVLADEIHADLIYPGHKHISFAGISEEFAQNTVTFMNPSKTFNVPGFRTAVFIAANPQLKSVIHDMAISSKGIGENICGTIAFCVAYEECAYYVDQLVTYLDGNRELAEKRLAEVPGINVIHPEGTYLLWLDCRGLGMSQPELDKFFVETVKLGFNSGTGFGPEGEGFLRMNISCPRATVEEALKRIENALKK